ncbi:MAG: aspartate kinase [Alphaproteobacteria bacterium]
MARIVQKFGGTSVADLDRIRNAATRVKRAVDAGDQVAVVVSAMAGETNRLIGLVRDASGRYDAKEYDAIVASGEQVTAGLMAIVLQSMGVAARSYLGWQIPLKTDGMHSRARIAGIDGTDAIQHMESGQVIVVAGFQGIGPENRITTLGRGGSDTTAVALAAALKADRCDIYTDVDGVYTCDPRIVPKARKIDHITYEEMLELASQGAKVLQTRSVEMAMNHNVTVTVLSSFEDKPGTLVAAERDNMEQEVVTGIAYDKNEAKITLVGVADRPGIAAAIFGPLTDAEINIDMIVQNISSDSNTTDMTFTVTEADFEPALAMLKSLKDDLNYREIKSDPNVVKISVVGVGMRSHAGVAGRMFKALAERGVNIQVISTSEIKVSVLIAEDYLELALRALHTAYGLDAA